MKFSIIIPMHNAEDRMKKILDSIRHQTFKDYELIIVCDKCTDSTKTIANAYAECLDDLKIKIITTKNGNVGLARNAGLKLAKGDYVMFADDDDMYLHPYVFNEIDTLTKIHPEADMLCFGFIFGKYGYTFPLSNGKNHNQLFPNVWSRVYKRELLDGIKFGTECPGEDLNFNTKVEAKAKNIFMCDSPIYFYTYPREGSLTDASRK